MIRGYATFPGVRQILEASIDAVHGISPSVASLTIVPQPGLVAAIGTLSFYYGNTRINFPGCKVDQASVERNSQGEVWRLAIFDRRWQWAWGKISGRYNLRKKDETLDTDTEATPQELAKKCLEAMGESDYDVSAMPDVSRPLADWEIEVPAEALANLCDQVGCRVVLGFGKKVRICKAGEGKELPEDGILSGGATLDSPEQPDKIAVACGPDRIQGDLDLEAVGRDTTDGAVKPIDELSYKPSGGWEASDPPWFLSVTASEKARKYAKETVFRWYRIKAPIEIPFGENHPKNITDIDSVLPIEAEQVATHVYEGKTQRKPAAVAGLYWNEGDTLANVVQTWVPDEYDDAENYWGRSIDTALGIVKFSKPIFRNTESASAPTKVSPGPALLRLRTAFSVRSMRDDDARAWLRYYKERSTGGKNGTPTRILRHPELIRAHIINYSSNWSATSVDTINHGDIEDACNYYLDAAEEAYRMTTPYAIRYIGLRKIEPDGAIQHVAFSVSAQGAVTSVGRNNELLHRTIPYKHRRQVEKQRKAVRDAG